MPSKRQYYSDKSGRHWRTVYVARQGPLKGRTYKNVSNYKRALERITGADIRKEERYNQLLQAFILQKGNVRGKKLQRFEELYRKAKKKDFDPCPPANGAGEDEVPYAYLLDHIGVRPLSEFGWLCIGDTPKA